MQSQADVLPDDLEQIQAPLHERLVGRSTRILEINALVQRLANVDLSVLIRGETGTGKDIVANQLHRLSPRFGKPFVKVNCPSIPHDILESELFGYERGAFTGADTAKPGRFEMAHEGTLFLDEICETAPAVQVKLLQVLDGEPILRIGGAVPVHSDMRVIAATNLDLDEAVATGRLREDISFRLREVVVELPPLRSRREDISLLAEHFNYNMCKMLKKEYQPLSPRLLEVLADMDFPGNVRELSGRIKKYVTTGSEEMLLAEEHAIGPAPAKAAAGPAHAERPARPAPREERTFMPLKEAARRAAEAAERALIEETLNYTLWNRRKAAKLLRTSYSSLLRRIDAYGIGKSDQVWKDAE
ncbi:MAG: sigma-54-dependent Fis family transcriptional regulator [Candidatus Hydrogenedentes bacterium]|nr:sigma-54-dependent Fis family transcriptional regulator [Candidatus Hydrogenedentota bacterium]